MKSFFSLSIKAKLAVVLFAALLPLLIAEGLTIRFVYEDLQKSAEEQLTNIVKHLHRAVRLHRESLDNPKRPDTNSLSYITEIFLSFKVGETGYPYVIKPDGTLVIHPSKAGENIIDSVDSKGRRFIEMLCAEAVRLDEGEVGTIRYPWMNPEEGETRARMKILKYTFDEKWGWIIAAGAYEEEVYAAIGPIEWVAAALIALSVFLVLLSIVIMNRLISKPVLEVAHAAYRFAHGELREKLPESKAGDEIAKLARSFNQMARQLESYTKDLEALIDHRTRALKESQEMYESLVENTPDGIVTADLSGTITFANSGMESMLEKPRDEIIGHKIYDFYIGGVEQAKEIMRSLREGGTLTNYEMEMIGKKKVIPILTSASLLKDADGVEKGTLGIFADITTLKQLEDELKEAQAHLIQSMKLRALGDLVAGVAHEINNPLMASTTMVHVLDKTLAKESSCYDDKMRKKIQVLQACNERIANIVNHLREFSRQSVQELSPLDINAPLSNALLITQQQLMNLRITLDKELGDKLPEIMGDKNHLEQVFLDMIANARDALDGKEGEKRIRISSASVTMDGQLAVSVSIEDNGTGVPEEIKDKIFEPFYTTKGVDKGTGLGLSICYGIIEAHGGRIDLEKSELGGAAFVIKIPAKEVQKA